MKTLKRILIGGAVVLALLVLVSQLLPGAYHVERSVVIAAKPEAIHPWLNNLRKWPEWSAWTKAKDSTLEYSYEGPEEGVGAISKWEAKKLGQGQMKLVESDVARGVKFELSFEHGKYLSTGTLSYTWVEGGTKLVWGVDGSLSRNPVDRFFGLLMEKFMAPDLEEGLGNWKKKAEGN